MPHGHQAKDGCNLTHLVHDPMSDVPESFPETLELELDLLPLDVDVDVVLGGKKRNIFFILSGGGRILASQPAALGLITSIPKKISEEKLSMLLRLINEPG